MSTLLQVKQQLHQTLNTQLDEKIQAIQQAMIEASESMKNDTKSSAGDKFETGREMIQQELNNQQAQMDKLLTFKKDMAQIDLQEAHNKVGFGSLILTSTGNYFISLALGKLSLNGSDYYALSLASPIGKALQNASVGEILKFQNRDIRILELA